eukprot:COSAG01_NODE_10887_length_2060_cov_2.668027_1_plen_417_part_10
MASSGNLLLTRDLLHSSPGALPDPTQGRRKRRRECEAEQQPEPTAAATKPPPPPPSSRASRKDQDRAMQGGSSAEALLKQPSRLPLACGAAVAGCGVKLLRSSCSCDADDDDGQEEQEQRRTGEEVRPKEHSRLPAAAEGAKGWRVLGEFEVGAGRARMSLALRGVAMGSADTPRAMQRLRMRLELHYGDSSQAADGSNVLQLSTEEGLFQEWDDGVPAPRACPNPLLGTGGDSEGQRRAEQQQQQQQEEEVEAAAVGGELAPPGVEIQRALALFLARARLCNARPRNWERQKAAAAAAAAAASVPPLSMTARRQLLLLGDLWHDGLVALRKRRERERELLQLVDCWLHRCLAGWLADRLTCVLGGLHCAGVCANGAGREHGRQRCGAAALGVGALQMHWWVQELFWAGSTRPWATS